LASGGEPKPQNRTSEAGTHAVVGGNEALDAPH
jgi:hypothetical protein